MPRRPRLDEGARRTFNTVTLSLDVVHGLTLFAPEVAHAFLILSLWSHKGEEVSEGRYLREVAQSDDPADLWPLEELVDCGLIITPEESKVRCEDWERSIYGDDDWVQSLNQRKEKRVLVVPDPFPVFLSGRWFGSRKTLAKTAPRPEIAVVYRLFGEERDLIYIGSSGNLYARLRHHPIKEWVHYEASECASRDAAYWLEAAQTIQHQPPKNGRDSVGGRITVLRNLTGPLESAGSWPLQCPELDAV
ncbi:hypothetical protein H4W32_008465 [Actinophytocola algeriensis]|uniref:GIY-YIG domain-containing protein n=1 Tax=Actinophytocola algeriensis TaxID=1768010 RepID=A0A7W7VHU6_9PSEU|nr:hypothetical protein [Actinophytocola algeriensis]MBE1480423.1 hypothetical protein [Actinophytocola algeriensis]